VASFGYRLTFITTNKTHTDIEHIFSGTIFNNTLYSARNYDFLEKLLLKLKDDYIIRTNSSYSTLDYVIQKVENKWLIINIKTGATDILNDAEIVIASAAHDLKDCCNEKNLLINDRRTEECIETLQAVVINYLEKRKTVSL
jgi:hypothetical protein